MHTKKHIYKHKNAQTQRKICKSTGAQIHKYTKTHILIYKLSTCARDKSLSLRTDLTDALPVLKRESHYAIYEAYSVVQVGLKVKGEKNRVKDGKVTNRPETNNFLTRLCLSTKIVRSQTQDSPSTTSTMPSLSPRGRLLGDHFHTFEGNFRVACLFGEQSFPFERKWKVMILMIYTIQENKDHPVF